MRLLKYYGPTMSGTIRRIKKELGEEALIVESRSVKRGSRTALLNPGARIEITVALEEPQTSSGSPKTSHEVKGEVVPIAGGELSRAGGAPKGERTALEELGYLKNQIHALLSKTAAVLARDEFGRVESSSPLGLDIHDQQDLADYRYLLSQGVDPGILARSFRRWLDWRLGTPSSESAHPPLFDPDAVMSGKSFPVWLWNEWQVRMIRDKAEGGQEVESGAQRAPSTQQIVGVVGAVGVGKSTTLAKMASIIRLKRRKRVAVVSLDSFRPGATEQWRQHAKLMDVAFFPVVTQEDASRCMESFQNFDWIGIDTPGALTPESRPGALYGSFLARCPHMQTKAVLDTLSRDQVNREQVEMLRPFRPDRLIFSKLDQAAQRGGLINLSFDGPWPIAMAATGSRVPEDLEEATPQGLWRWVFQGLNAGAEPGPRGAESSPAPARVSRPAVRAYPTGAAA